MGLRDMPEGLQQAPSSGAQGLVVPEQAGLTPTLPLLLETGLGSVLSGSVLTAHAPAVLALAALVEAVRALMARATERAVDHALRHTVGKVRQSHHDTDLTARSKATPHVDPPSCDS